MKFISQRLDKLQKVPDEQLRDLCDLLATRFPAGAVAARAELDNRQGNSARPYLTSITGDTGAADDLRGLFGVGAILEQSQQGAGMTASIAAVEEMILATRCGMEINDDRRDLLALQLGLAF
jgi:predicted flap endonuclease-1-like 5' DNA nuclease